MLILFEVIARPQDQFGYFVIRQIVDSTIPCGTRNFRNSESENLLPLKIFGAAFLRKEKVLLNLLSIEHRYLKTILLFSYSQLIVTFTLKLNKTKQGSFSFLLVVFCSSGHYSWALFVTGTVLIAQGSLNRLSALQTSQFGVLCTRMVKK